MSAELHIINPANWFPVKYTGKGHIYQSCYGTAAEFVFNGRTFYSKTPSTMSEALGINDSVERLKKELI